jgi:hypothetical protein
MPDMPDMPDMRAADSAPRVVPGTNGCHSLPDLPGRESLSLSAAHPANLAAPAIAYTSDQITHEARAVLEACVLLIVAADLR